MKKFSLGLILFIRVASFAGMDSVSQSTLCSVTLNVTSSLPYSNTPMDPKVDFGALIARTGLEGRLDLNSIEVIDLEQNTLVPHALSEDFSYGDKGRVEWVMVDPERKEYEIRFGVVPRRPALKPSTFTPRIGTGDVLRYNAGTPRPLSLPYPSGLVDLTGDGLPDLVGGWNYAQRFGSPWDGIVCYPRVGGLDELVFGEMRRVRSIPDRSATDYKHFTDTYAQSSFADLDGDGLVDLVFSPSRGTEIRFYLNTGERDEGGMPEFVASGSIDRRTSDWEPCRVADLNEDGALDLFIGNIFLRNTNPDGWPIIPAAPTKLDAGDKPCFFDVDGDGLLDSVCLVEGVEDKRVTRAAWRKNLGTTPSTFGSLTVLADIDEPWCVSVAAVREGPNPGLLIGGGANRSVSFYRQRKAPTRFVRLGKASSRSAPLAAGDQAWPCVCDWEGDGDLDLLVGGGYGWPRIILNEGNNERPAYAEPKYILSEGKPIRILRDDVLGSEHWHNMGYSYPVYDDVDGDGLPDLLLPNETNRIFWYKNIGARAEPTFGERRQIVCEGYPDSPAAIERTARLAGDKSVPNHPYPYEEDRPFFWRTGAAFSDWNGDGTLDLITHDGFARKATLFAQRRDATGELVFRKGEPLQLTDGRVIDDKIIERKSHWTESFRACDWDDDGLTDLVYSLAGAHGGIQDGGSIFLLRNAGSRTGPIFEPPRTLRCFGKPIFVSNHGPNPWVGDVDGDGKPDLVTCVEWSVYPYFSHAAIEMPERPEYEIGEPRVR